MTDKKIEKTVSIVNEQGKTVMSMSSMGRAGDKISMKGIMMGSWPADMYVGPEDVWTMVVMVLKTPTIILYVLQLPFILSRVRAEKRKKLKAGQNK